jgi:hypothetical protein
MRNIKYLFIFLVVVGTLIVAIKERSAKSWAFPVVVLQLITRKSVAKANNPSSFRDQHIVDPDYYFDMHGNLKRYPMLDKKCPEVGMAEMRDPRDDEIEFLRKEITRLNGLIKELQENQWG